ncbi:MAG: membrane protein insertase YidC [Endomicrobium sp.]|jgi:YidC/Oxa1 family membrane protein insertase|nr:membrane protein insertase YidC [Endomicrobium sp.]
MQKNSFLFVILSSLTIFVWFFFLAPKEQHKVLQSNNTMQSQVGTSVETINKDSSLIKGTTESYVEEEKINIENEIYKAVLTNKGAGVLSWSVKEKDGQWVDLIFEGSQPVMANFPGSIYKVVSKSDSKIVFEYTSKEGWKITKTYNLDKNYMHNLNISVEKTRQDAIVPQIDLSWGPGLGTDLKEQKENISLTRALAYTLDKPYKLKKLKNEIELATDYKWAAIDNRYFLAAFIPENSKDFDKIIPSRLDKKYPVGLSLEATFPKDLTKKEYFINFYLGPKGYTYLKSYNLGLEKTVDFGFFGFLGKIAFAVLTFFYGLTNNYGWAIIMITIVIQILVFPLTLKSLKSTAAMKRVQPFIKEIQAKYKDNPQRLQSEMISIYRTQKVNPLGGCLPMLLQLPIFWAFFTMLRNAYELRSASWILWVKDLSAADHFMMIGVFCIHLLPLIMGFGMFLQQKMTAVTSDPTQKKIMYIMPILFTFMFWSFPSGLVIYWITNSAISMIEQYFVLKKAESYV